MDFVCLDLNKSVKSPEFLCYMNPKRCCIFLFLTLLSKKKTVSLLESGCKCWLWSMFCFYCRDGDDWTESPDCIRISDTKCDLTEHLIPYDM